MHRRVAGVLLLAVAGGCAPMEPGDPAPEFASVAFVNSTVSSTSVYLESGGRTWLLGRVDPGQSVLLRLPAGITPSGLYSLIAVPLGARDNFGRSAGNNPNAIRSMAGSADDLLALRFTLLETQLVTMTRPDAGVAAAKRVW